jgi:signal transduction histidine kinase
MILRQLPIFLVKLCSSIACFAWMSITCQIAVFGNLRTSTKLFLLCGVFLLSIFIATYGLVAEKLIAIEFARKELVGAQYLEAVHEVYAWILAGLTSPSTFRTGPSANRVLNRLADAQAHTAGSLHTAELAQSVAEAVRKLSSGPANGEKLTLIVDALAKARNLASRVGDDSNLALDPDLDSYYVQDIVVTKMPTLLGQIGELQSLLEAGAPVVSSSDAPTVRPLILDGMIRSTFEEIKRDMEGAYRGKAGDRLRQILGPDIAAMAPAGEVYLGATRSSLGASASASLDQSYARVVDNALRVWGASQGELSRLLNTRLSNLLAKLRGSLILNGLLAISSIALALITYRHIVQPLRKLERLADDVRETKDYSLRTNYQSKSEIGRLALAFDGMLAELAEAREREAAEQSRIAAMQAELARVAPITAMGEMTASIAHEVNQPLAAVVNNANAGLRWLDHQPPNVERTRSILVRIVNDGGRASEVIASIRAMLTKGSQAKAQLDINDLIRDVITLVRGELQRRGVSIRTELANDLPRLSGSQAQLRQVLLNLIMNAVEAMASITDRARVLDVRSASLEHHDVVVTVQDTGTGVTEEDRNRIFEAFFTTKPEGMGMGLSICRSIVEAHGGRIAASPANPHGSVFQVVLPIEEPNQLS